MTKRNLETLKDLPVPLPRPEAKNAALRAAKAAFAEQGQSQAGEAAQGNVVVIRPMDVSSVRNRSRPMRTSRYVAIAASVAATLITAPLALMYLETGESPANLARAPAPSLGVEPATPADRLMPRDQMRSSGRDYSSQSQTIQKLERITQYDKQERQPVEYLRQYPSPSQEPPLAVDQNRDRFSSAPANPWRSAQQEPVSTFSVDVDTASYAFVRRLLNGGRLPARESVRIEEMINYFSYAYPVPENAQSPFRTMITVVPTPWNASTRLMHVAIKGYDLTRAERPRANLVFLIDVSGSMAPEDRLPLVKTALKMLLDSLAPEDKVGIVTYASDSGIALQPTEASNRAKIVSAIDALQAGGSTAGASGIQDAYRLAEQIYDKGAVNRIVLATDGDFNVGITDVGELRQYVEEKRKTGIYLSVLGVGRGNLNDQLMQALAQNGNGTAAYIDTLNEARKVLVEEASSTLFVIAKDVKIQIEFNPRQISEYRLIGYETRTLRREDFNNDKVDAGDVGSGHAVTAIYEITPAGAERKNVDDLRYRAVLPAPAPRPAVPGELDSELAFFKMRYKLPNEDESRLITLPVTPSLERRNIADATADVRFSVAVAAFGEMLRGSPYLRTFGYDEIIALANGARSDDAFGLRAEFVNLVRVAKSLQTR